MNLLKINRLIEKVKTYNNHVLILSDLTGLTQHDVKRILQNKKKFNTVLIKPMLEIEKIIDLNNKKNKV